MSKIRNPYVFIGILVLAVLASGLMCEVYSSATAQAPSSLMFTNGTTVVSGDKIIDLQNTQKVPLVANPNSIIRPLKNLQIDTVFFSLVTFTVPKDYIKNDTYITSSGAVSDKLNGPGVVVLDENGKMSVEQADHMVWGYKLPYVTAVKSGDSVKLIQNNTTISTVSANDINNETIPNDYVGTTAFKEWFNSSKDGANITVDYYLGAFNDNRSGVYGKENIIHAFGQNAYDYMRNYTPEAPVLVYEHNATKTNISSGASVVEYLAGYPTEVRAANAKEFAVGWNGTIIPPHTSAHGKENVSFTSIAESEAASGSATHGVCPPGRSLRQAVLALGYPLPVGMAAVADEAILYEYRPTIDVSVYNAGDYPIEIIMWTEGESGDTRIYTSIIELKDNATYVTSNSTNSTD